MRPKVVVVGAGFGGLAVAEGLAGEPVDVLLVDRNNFHTFQPLLYQVATADLEPGDIAYPARAMTRRHANLDFRMGTATGVDWDQQELSFENGAPERFDQLALASGLTTNFFGVEGAEEHALPMKTIQEAVALRTRVLRSFEACADDPTLPDRGGARVIVVGGGPTGVELAGALTELLFDLQRDFTHLDLSSAEVVLLELGDVLLAPYADARQRYARAALTKMGVKIRTGTSVIEVTADGVRLDTGESVPCCAVIWAAGVRPVDFIDALDLEQGHGGRIVVDEHNRSTTRSNVFAIGDVAATTGADGSLIPQLAQPAMQTGRHVAQVISADLAGASVEPFHYRDKGTMATIGQRRAVVEFPAGRGFTGLIAWVSWLLLHLGYLAGFRNRLHVLVNWIWTVFTRDRGARLIGKDLLPFVPPNLDSDHSDNQSTHTTS
jgi:NADH dehydrogenase